MNTALLERELAPVPTDEELLVVSFDQPETTVGVLRSLEKTGGQEKLVAQSVRDMLGKMAITRQNEAIESLAANTTIELPYGMYWQNIIGAEAIYAMTQARKQNDLSLTPVKRDENVMMELKAR